MIEAAADSLGRGRHWADFGIIFVLLLGNAVVGFWEEYQAGNAIAALKKKLALRAQVKRGGPWITVAARELVPGDLIRLRIGDIVPADAKLLEGDPIEVDQSALTGESLPVDPQDGRGGLLRLDRPAGRDRRVGLRHRRQDLLRQDGPSGRDGPHGQPLPEGGAEDRRLSDRVGRGAGGADPGRRPVPRRSDAASDGRSRAAVRPGADRGGHPRGHADGALGHDGRRGADALRARRRSSAGWRPSRSWPAWTSSARTRPAR